MHPRPHPHAFVARRRNRTAFLGGQTTISGPLARGEGGVRGRSGLAPRGSSPDPNPQTSGSPGVNLPPLAGCLAPGTKTSLAGRVPGAYGPRRHPGRAGHSRLRGQRFLQLGTRPSAHLFLEPEGFSLGLPSPLRKRCLSNLPPHLLAPQLLQLRTRIPAGEIHTLSRLMARFTCVVSTACPGWTCHTTAAPGYPPLIP